MKPEGTKKLTKKSSGLMRITGRIPGEDVPYMFPMCSLCVSYCSRSYKNFYRVHPGLTGEGMTVRKSSRAPPVQNSLSLIRRGIHGEVNKNHK